MPTLPERILALLQHTPGLTDREIATQLSGRSAPQQPVNIAARSLAKRGHLLRAKRPDGLIGNYPSEKGAVLPTRIRQSSEKHDPNALSEDALKKALEGWLSSAGWTTEIAWGRKHGVDVRATRRNETWLFEVKGIGSLSAMRVNYFIGILGETLQRMKDPAAKHSIALPDVPQFRGLWNRLPALAKKRTEITMLFVSASGSVTELSS